MREIHDKAVDREGVFDKATTYMREAIELGYRVCTNTTIYRGVDPEEYVELFRFLKDMGVEGCITAPGFDYESVTHDREQFLAKRESQELYSRVHELCDDMDIPFYNNPLFHEFLQGSAPTAARRGRCPPTPSRAGAARATCWPTSTWAASRSCTTTRLGRLRHRIATRAARTA